MITQNVNLLPDL